MKNRKYIQYSSAFQPFFQRKISRCQLLPIYSELPYIFGDDMGSTENRHAWIQYNIKTPDVSWRAAIGEKRGEKAGFILYTIADRCISINDIEICKSHRFDPFLLRELFKTLFLTEADNFDSISGYINKANRVSQNNFLKYATKIEERARGYAFFIDAKNTAFFKKKIQKALDF